jgi:hypothetical protein
VGFYVAVVFAVKRNQGPEKSGAGLFMPSVVKYDDMSDMRGMK